MKYEFCLLADILLLNFAYGLNSTMLYRDLDCLAR